MQEALTFIGKLIAVGGGGAAIAYLVFQFLGRKWIENIFSERLEQLRHQQALELQRLRVEIDALLSGVIKLQEKEFVILPEAWAKLDEAHSSVSWLAAPLQTYAQVNEMSIPELDEFLSDSDLTESQRESVRQASDRLRTYSDIIFWHRLHKVKGDFNELHTYIARNGIFLPPGLKENFSMISRQLRSALISLEIGHESQDWGMKRQAWAQIKEESEPLYQQIEAEIHARLQSHGRHA